MLRVIAFLLVTALLIAGAVWLADRPGAVSIHWLGWRVETSVPIFLLVNLLVAGIAYAILKVLRLIASLPRRVVDLRRDRRQRKGLSVLADGLAAVTVGDQRRARQLAQRADRLLDNPPLTSLLSAQAAQLSGDRDAARAHFTAMLERQETLFAGLKGLLFLSIEDGKLDEALDFARRAHALHPRAEWLTATLFDVQVRQKLWREAEETLKTGARHGAFGPAEVRRKRALLLNEQSVKAEADGDTTWAGKLAQKAHGADPGFTAATLRLARLLDQFGKGKKALSTLEDAWGMDPHPDIADAYARLGSGTLDAMERTRRLEKLIKLDPNAPAAYVAAGQAALDAKLWGQARSHLLTAVAKQPTSRAYRLLAQVDEAEGHPDAARTWLEKATEAPAEPHWTCTECGHKPHSWSSLCGKCGGFDTLTWSGA